MIREIIIRPVLNGFLVNVGCQQVVMGSKKALLSNLEEYLDNPRKVEAAFLKGAINKQDEKMPAPCPPSPEFFRNVTDASCGVGETPLR